MKESSSPEKQAMALLEVAKATYQKYAEELVEATETALPIDTVVRVTLGRSRITGVVVDHGGHWWYQPDEVIILNLETNKRRSFCASSKFCQLEIVQLPALKKEAA